MSNKVKPLIVTTEEAGQRLDKWIKFHFSNISKIMVEKLCRTGQIRVDSALSLIHISEPTRPY